MIARVLPAARDEAREAEEYYETKGPGLGTQFVDALAEALRQIEAHPRMFPIIQVRGLRRECCVCLVERFPFHVVYEIRPDEILVYAVSHHRRRPGYWIRRTR